MESESDYDSDDYHDINGDDDFYEFVDGTYDDARQEMDPELINDLSLVAVHKGDDALSYKCPSGLDELDLDLLVDARLQEDVAIAWGLIPRKPVIVQLQLVRSLYRRGSRPSACVVQYDNNGKINKSRACNQLTKILEMFVSQYWIERPGAGMKTSLSFSLPRANEPSASLTKSQTMQNIGKDGFVIIPSSTKNGLNAKTLPSCEHGFLVQIMDYISQRIPTLNEYCVVCDEAHIFQNGAMLKPAVCSRELCVFAYQTLGVMADTADEVASGAEVIDLLLRLFVKAALSTRNAIALDPFPTVVDPGNPCSLALCENKKDYKKVTKLSTSLPPIVDLLTVDGVEMVKMLDSIDKLLSPLMQWIITSNRSHIVRLPEDKQLYFMHTPHQFLLLCSPPVKEARFQAAKRMHGSLFAMHGSAIENWHSILRNGLVVGSGTKRQMNGAAYGNGIYLSPCTSLSMTYSGMGRGGIVAPPTLTAGLRSKAQIKPVQRKTVEATSQQRTTAFMNLAAGQWNLLNNPSTNSKTEGNGDKKNTSSSNNGCSTGITSSGQLNGAGDQQVDGALSTASASASASASSNSSNDSNGDSNGVAMNIVDGVQEEAEQPFVPWIFYDIGPDPLNANKKENVTKAVGTSSKAEVKPKQNQMKPVSNTSAAAATKPAVSSHQYLKKIVSQKQNPGTGIGQSGSVSMDNGHVPETTKKREKTKRFLSSDQLCCIALCEVINSSDTLTKHGGNVWVCSNPDHVCTRFLFVYEDGKVGECIDTTKPDIERQIRSAVGYQTSS